jgi:hypothetical protein
VKLVFVVAFVANCAAFIFGILLILQGIDPQYQSSTNVEDLLIGLAVVLGSLCSLLIFLRRASILVTPSSWLGLEIEARKARLRSRIREAGPGE